MNTHNMSYNASHDRYKEENEKEMSIQNNPTYLNRAISDQREDNHMPHNPHAGNHHTQRMTNYINEIDDERTLTQKGVYMYPKENTYNVDNVSSTEPFVNLNNDDDFRSNKNRNICSELKSEENKQTDRYKQNTCFYGYNNFEKEQEKEREIPKENRNDQFSKIHSDRNEYKNRSNIYPNENYPIYETSASPTVPLYDCGATKSYEQIHAPTYFQNCQEPTESNNLLHDKKIDEKNMTYSNSNAYQPFGVPSKDVNNNIHEQHEEQNIKDMCMMRESRNYNEKGNDLHAQVTSVSKKVIHENAAAGCYRRPYNFYQRDEMSSPIQVTKTEIEKQHEQMRQGKLELKQTEITQGEVPEYLKHWEGRLQRVPLDKVDSLSHLEVSNEHKHMNNLTPDCNMHDHNNLNSHHYQYNRNSPNSRGSLEDPHYQYNTNSPNSPNSRSSPNNSNEPGPNEEALRPISDDVMNRFNRDANYYRAKNMSHVKIFDYVDTYNKDDSQKYDKKKKFVDTFVPRYSNLSARETLYKNLSGNDSITILAANKMDFDRLSQKDAETSLPNVYPFSISERVNKQSLCEKKKNQIKLLPANSKYVSSSCVNNIDISLAERRQNMNSSHIFDTMEIEETESNYNNSSRDPLNFIYPNKLKEEEQIEYKKGVIEKEEKRKMNPMYSDLFGRKTPDTDVTKTPKEKLLSATIKNNWLYHASDVKKYEDSVYENRSKNAYEQREHQEPEKFYRKSYFGKDGYDNTERLQEALKQGSKVSLQAHLQSSFQNEKKESYKMEDFTNVETFYLTLYNLKDSISDEVIKQVVKNSQAHLVSYKPDYDLLSNKRKSTAKMCIRHNKGREGLQILESMFSQMQVKLVAN